MSQWGDLAASDIAGVILIGDEDQVRVGRDICRKRGVSEFPDQTDWAEFFVVHPMQTVVIALPYKGFSWIEEKLEFIADQVPDVKLLPDLMKFTRLACMGHAVAASLKRRDCPIA